MTSTFNKHLSVLFVLTLLAIGRTGAQTKIVALGSSTTWGSSATHNDSAWVGRLQMQYRRNTSPGDPDTVVIRKGWWGYTTYHCMPTGYQAANRPAVDPAGNITAAIAEAPQIIIINLPSNDVANVYWSAGYTIQETLSNFRTMYQQATAAGIRCYITTTQPRNDMSVVQKQLQKDLRDSILSYYGANAINFWDDLVTPDGTNTLRDEVRNLPNGDADYHLNNTGHRLIYERVRQANIFGGSTPPPPPPPPAVSYVSIPAKIEAEAYTAMSGVQTEATADAGGGQNVGYIDQGDWMEYRVNAAASGSFTFSARVASPLSGGQLQVRNGAGATLATIGVPNTGSWQSWTTVQGSVSLPAGNQTLRIVSTSGTGWNLNWIEFSTGGNPPPPPPVNYTAIPARIEAEAYATQSGTQLETTSDAGGGQNVGYIDQGDWMHYHISTAAAGTFTFRARVASAMSGGQLQVKNSGGAILATLAVPATGGWQSWTTVTGTLDLPAGNQTLQVLSSAAPNWNLNWIEFATAGGPPPPPPTVSYVTIPAKIEAEAHTAMSGVQAEATADAGGGQNIGWIDQGDWLEYQISVPSSGTYTLHLRIATPMSQAQVQVLSSGQVLTTASLPSSGGWQSWTTVPLTVQLSAGNQTLRLLSSAAGNWNLNWLEFTQGGSTPPPPSYVAIPAKIEAEAYTAMSGVQTESTGDAGGGLNVGYIDQSDWMHYAIAVSTGGQYELRLRVASPMGTGTVQARIGESTILASAAIPNTGGWQNWTTITLAVTLPQGNHTLRLTATGTGNWNINWLEFAPAPAPSARYMTTLPPPVRNTGTDFRMYPNPVRDDLTLDLDRRATGPLTVEVLHSNGSLVRKFSLAKTGTTAQYQVSLQGLTPGVYLVRLRMDRWTHTQTVVKQ